MYHWLIKYGLKIIKFLMLNGIMATVNQLIDVDVIKKICAEYELEVLDEDLDAYMEEELEKEGKEKKLTEVDKKLLRSSMERLNPREKNIMELRSGFKTGNEKTQKEVADMLGISQSYISRLEKKIISKMKKEIMSKTG